jgi:hypothetical protein
VTLNLAPPGSGKTYSFGVICLNRSQQGLVTIVAFHSHTALMEFREFLEVRLAVPSKIIYSVTATLSGRVTFKEAMIYLLHHCYLLPMGDLFFYHRIFFELKDLETKPCILIDEAQLFLKLKALKTISLTVSYSGGKTFQGTSTPVFQMTREQSEITLVGPTQYRFTKNVYNGVTELAVTKTATALETHLDLPLTFTGEKF